jgi:hypothetical protein
MASNTTLLIVITALAVLALAGAFAGVTYKTRTPKRGETIRDQAETDTLRLRRHEALANEYAARAHAAEVEIEIKTIRASSLQQQATVYRGEAVTSRDQLNELRDSADKLTSAARPPATV